MRLGFVVVLSVLAAGALAQLRVGEARALDDALTLANLRPADLGSVPPPVGALAAHVAALKMPTAGLVEANARHASATSDDVALLRTAFGLVGGTLGRATDSGVAEVPSSVPETLRRPVGVLVAAIVVANAEIRAATSRLAPNERRTLIEALPRLAADDPTLPLDFAKGPSPDFSTVRRLLDLVDVNRIEAAGVALAAVVKETMPSLQSSAGLRFQKTIFRSRGILVELSDNQPDLHTRKDVGLCIDLGGDDRYSGRYAAGAGYAGVLIDLSGNDRYYGSDLNLGAGILGIGLLFDLGGDDVYAVRSVGLGCGIAGVGLFSDASGDDRYRVVGLGLGAGARGIGLFVDRLGDDAYFAGRSGEGFGTLQGLGWSVDAAGDDTYRGGDSVQAVGTAGGFGLLTDLGGNDFYQAASGQAAAIGGYASLGDSMGDDQYVVAGNGQAFASSGGVAYLIDTEGDDSYLMTRGQGQAAAFGGVAVLLDREGNDVYGGTDGSPATAYAGGVALLLDAGGDDRYLSSAPFRASGGGIALWIDGNGRDRYGDGRSDAQAMAGDATAAYDLFGASEPVTILPNAPAPGSLTMPPAAEFVTLRRQAADGPNRAAAVGRLVGIGVPALSALAADPDGGTVFVAVATRLGAAAEPMITSLAVSPDARLTKLALSCAGFVKIPSEVLLAALGRPELSLVAAEAAGKAKSMEAVPLLMRMAASSDLATIRTAVGALASIGDPQAGSTVAIFADHDDLVVRRAAFRYLASVPALAESTGRRLVTTGESFRQRVGFALLGKAGTPGAFTFIGPYLQKGSRDAKIGALLALDGHVPTELIVAVEALRRDEDPLVRAVASRIDVGPSP